MRFRRRRLFLRARDGTHAGRGRRSGRQGRADRRRRRCRRDRHLAPAAAALAPSARRRGRFAVDMMASPAGFVADVAKIVGIDDNSVSRAVEIDP